MAERKRHSCPECGATLIAGKTCQDDFHELLFWENQYPQIGKVHHLLVLCYHLQHPSLYSPEGLEYSLQLLVDFVENRLTTTAALQRGREQVRSDRRDWKITASPGSQGAYAHPIDWKVRAADITAAGPQEAIPNIQAWAMSILADLRTTGNLTDRDSEDK